MSLCGMDYCVVFLQGDVFPRETWALQKSSRHMSRSRDAAFSKGLTMGRCTATATCGCARLRRWGRGRGGCRRECNYTMRTGRERRAI